MTKCPNVMHSGLALNKQPCTASVTTAAVFGLWCVHKTLNSVPLDSDLYRVQGGAVVEFLAMEGCLASSRRGRETIARMEWPLC